MFGVKSIRSIFNRISMFFVSTGLHEGFDRMVYFIKVEIFIVATVDSHCLEKVILGIFNFRC